MLLILLSVLASKLSDRFGIPALVLFLALGMLAGSDGPGGVAFDDPVLAQFLGVAALALILFSGGLSTSWKEVRPVLGHSVTLATLGVLNEVLSYRRIPLIGRFWRVKPEPTRLHYQNDHVHPMTSRTSYWLRMNLY